MNSAGTVYIADPDNNRIVVTPAGGGTQTVITATTGLTPATLSGPKGVAVDSTGSVYISDTGNNRILKMDASSGAFSVLGNYVWISGSLCDGGSTTAPCPATKLSAEPGAVVSATTPPPQYAFKAPQGLAVDSFNNVYVADTGNSAVVEIPSNIALGGAVPLLNYPGAPKFSAPVAIAIDSQNNIWVADNKLQGQVIVELPPGGGDLATIPGAQFPNTKAAGLSTPNGIAVDAAGNVYVSDSGTNTVVELPSGSGQGNTPFALNFIGLSTPAGLALDANGNLYVADSANKQVLLDFRQNPVVNFGTVPQGKTAQPLCSGTVLSDGFNNGTNTTPCVLTVTNIGSQPVTLTAPLTSLSGTANAAFNSPVPDSCASITGGGPLPAGISCTISPTFTPTANSGQTETLNVNGGPQSIAFNGERSTAAGQHRSDLVVGHIACGGHDDNDHRDCDSTAYRGQYAFWHGHVLVRDRCCEQQRKQLRNSRHPVSRSGRRCCIVPTAYSRSGCSIHRKRELQRRWSKQPDSCDSAADRGSWS